eukprot:COSAG01_NODE_3038_length_6684_cov_114.904480_7_plen_111_part_01
MREVWRALLCACLWPVVLWCRLHHSARSHPCPTRPPSTPRRDYAFHLRDWRYAAISLGAPVGVRSDTPPLKAIEPPPSAPPHTQTLRRRAEGGAADAPLLGRRRPTSTTGA